MRTWQTLTRAERSMMFAQEINMLERARVDEHECVPREARVQLQGRS